MPSFAGLCVFLKRAVLLELKILFMNSMNLEGSNYV